jgi:hypothetical protein
MKRTFDNFQAVDSGFASFAATVNPTIKLDALVSQLDQKYKDALVPSNLDFYLNSVRKQDLINSLITIANDNTLSGSQKITNAITTIEGALPYLKTPIVVMTRNAPSVTTSVSTSPINMLTVSPPQWEILVQELAQINPLIYDALSSKVNAMPQNEWIILRTKLESIANNTTLTKEQKKSQIEQELLNAFPTSSNTNTKSTEGDEKPPFDIVKIGLIVVALGIVGYIGYVSIKK